MIYGHEELSLHEQDGTGILLRLKCLEGTSWALFLFNFCMNNYELTVVLPGTLAEAKQNAVLEKIKGLVKESGGDVVKLDKWGKRMLAYPIKKQKEGFFYLLNLELEAEKANPISHLLDHDDQVIRHLLVRSGKVVAPEPEKIEVEKKKEKVEKKKKTK